jgi:transposase-like protein
MSKPAANPFRYFNSLPQVIRLVVMMYVRFPLSLRNVEDLPFECGVHLCHEKVRLSREGATVVEQVRPDFRQRHPTAREPQRLSPLAMLGCTALVGINVPY